MSATTAPLRSAADEADAVVVGGGPAGACAAALLARGGLRVVLLDRARFPRAKACAECLSPEAARVLDRLGVLERVDAAGPARLTGMVVRAPGGAQVRGDYLASHGYRAYRDHCLALPRTTLDPILLDAARAAGVEVREGVRVVDVERDMFGRVTGVSCASPTEAARVSAPLIVGADGLRSLVARRLGLERRAPWPRRLALVAHFRGVRELGPLVEMHVERDGFVGVADVGGGLANVSLVVPMRNARDAGGDAAGFLDRWLARRPQLAHRFANAERASPVRATGPFASHARRAWSPGAALVGDAADFFDPFTGEGIYAALRGGELLAPFAIEALGATSARAADRALARYHRARRSEFAGKWIVERLIAAAVGWAPAMNYFSRTLEARKDMADLLVGVTGNFVPAREVLRPAYLLNLFRSSTSSPAPGA